MILLKYIMICRRSMKRYSQRKIIYSWIDREKKSKHVMSLVEILEELLGIIYLGKQDSTMCRYRYVSGRPKEYDQIYSW
jgi:hypothetical protein